MKSKLKVVGHTLVGVLIILAIFVAFVFAVSLVALGGQLLIDATGIGDFLSRSFLILMVVVFVAGVIGWGYDIGKSIFGD